MVVMWLLISLLFVPIVYLLYWGIANHKIDEYRFYLRKLKKGMFKKRTNLLQLIQDANKTSEPTQAQSAHRKLSIDCMVI